MTNNSIDSLKWRYAVKKFDSERILPEEKITLLKEAFNLTATSYGLQPIRLIVLQNKSLQEQLVAHSFGQLQVAQASHILVLCIEDNIDPEFILEYFKRVKQIRNTPQEILDPYQENLLSDFSQMETESIRQWSINQAYLAMGNLLTVCAVEQIDSCPMEGFVPQAYDDLLKLGEKGLHAVLVLPVGYRAPDDEFSGFKKVRRSLEESVIDMGR